MEFYSALNKLYYICSPSGCTFWGKKPWSRKKKILWQLGLLIGAPLGIALVAGVAVPAIIIGTPVWIGKKVRQWLTVFQMLCALFQSLLLLLNLELHLLKLAQILSS